MRVAIVHDWLTGMRGGEKVLLSLLNLFPDATIFTLLHVRGSVAPEIEAREIRTTFVQHLPGAARRYRHYLPLFPAAAASLDVSGFDLVISSSHCVAKGVRVVPPAVHICYCHTPMRYIWDRFDEYFGRERVGVVSHHLIRLVAEGLRGWDLATAPRVHHFVANSRYVAGRIRRCYGRDSTVIPPPVDADFFTPGPPQDGTYDLVVSALAPYKRLELVLEAYRDTGRPLKIVGTGPEAARLQAIASKEVSFLGHVEDQTLRDLYRGCRTVIMPGVEDFGIVPLEAMACGRPAIVFAEGGGPESVIDGETGLVFAEATPEALRACVDSIQGLRFNTAVLRQRAEAHSRQVFEAKLMRFVEDTLRTSASPSLSW
jgi:glycosyltransferase involved in cell wall biosynthesis